MSEPSEAAKQQAWEIIDSCAVAYERDEEIGGGRVFVTAARSTLTDRIASELDARDAEIEKLRAQLAMPPRSRSKKQKIEESLRQSDLTARLAGRDDVEYGHHESLPRGEHVARRGSR